jgi:putative ABC transport system permease protein
MGRIHYAVRSLAKAPMLSLVVILSLGLGIGANTAIFSLLHQMVLASLPVPHPERLVLVTAPQEFKSGRSSSNDSGDSNYIFSYPVFRALEKNSQAMAGLAGFRNLGANLSFVRQTVDGSINLVSGQYFPVLGVRPIFGRTVEPGDDGPPGGGNPVAVLGYGYWHDKLGGRTEVLNQPIRINGQLFTIVGVLPRDFTGVTLGQEPDAYVPMSFKPLMTPNWNGTDRYDDYWIYLVGRLKPGTTRAQAADALNSTYRGLVEEHAKTVKWRDPNRIQRYRESRLSVVEGRQGNSGNRDNRRTPLFILMGATAMVLLIAMANAANLLLARSAQRRRELAIRAAMGAARGELMWQLLTEALLLAAAGGAAGILLGRITTQLLISMISSGDTVYFVTSDLEWPVLLFALGLSLLTGLIFGLYPAWDGARASVSMTLKDESGQSSSNTSAARVRKALVVAQVTIATILLIPTGLFLKSLVNLLHVDLGFKTENVIGFSVSPLLNGYNPERARALFERSEAELAAIPGVRGVATALVPLIGNSNWGTDVKVEGGSPAVNNDSNGRYNEVGPGYFGKMGIPLIAGREFTESDTAAGPKVTVVTEQFVKAFLEGRNPIGLKVATDGAFDTEIIGVVKDHHYSAVKQDPPKLFYTPWRQDKRLNNLNFYVRTAIPTDQVFQQIRRVMRGIDSDLPLESMRTLDEQVRRNIRNDQIVLQLAAAFAILATALAMLGLYGVMAHSVTRRTREIGIRMALGAAPARIQGMVLREMLWILGIGLLVGVPSAMALAKLTETQLFGVKSSDAVVIAAATAALAVTAAAAAYLPARRAARINPIRALRYE